MRLDAEFICRALPLISTTPMQYITKMLKRTAALDVAATSLIIANQNNSNDWIYFFERLIHATDLACNSPGCVYKALPDFIGACQKKLEYPYIPIRDRLRGEDWCSAELQLWEEFAAAVGVSEEKLLEKWEREGKCCFPCCAKRAGGKAEKNKMVKRCSGCLEVRYHDRTCQKADWNRHRSICKLKARQREGV
ncbi:hypothetical protein PILCRDRAFT_425321 [Piloderma croceum F 1598]|uniref:MYND-type domain-containing protein n=1 Tax=Piloderma croceum (strain F 1598) TaxID=765440 RepID=A0A0C3FYV7_PILCF|nr:hypothetical protein PILCRDRAFT_425321 [Piloderma croceum F 1598]